MKGRLVQSHAERVRRIESGDIAVVGVNWFTETAPSPLADRARRRVGDPRASTQRPRREQLDALERGARAARRRRGRAPRSTHLRAVADDRRQPHARDDRLRPRRRHRRRVGGRAARGVRRVPRAHRRRRGRRAPTGADMVAGPRAGPGARPRARAARSASSSASPGSTATPTAPSRSRSRRATPAWRSSTRASASPRSRSPPPPRDEDVDIVGLSILSGSHRRAGARDHPPAARGRRRPRPSWSVGSSPRPTSPRSSPPASPASTRRRTSASPRSWPTSPTLAWHRRDRAKRAPRRADERADGRRISRPRPRHRGVAALGAGARRARGRHRPIARGRRRRAVLDVAAAVIACRGRRGSDRPRRAPRTQLRPIAAPARRARQRRAPPGARTPPAATAEARAGPTAEPPGDLAASSEERAFDPVSGLLRRAVLRGDRATGVAAARRQLQPVSVVFFELDGLDRTGRRRATRRSASLGDVACADAARERRRLFRIGDIVAAAVLEDTAEPGAVLGRRARPRARCVASPVGDSLTVSAGIACYPSRTLGATELVRAGVARRRSRALGRDHVELAPDA